MLFKNILKAVGIMVISMSLIPVTSSLTHAQGQDSTIAEKDIMILGEMLPGIYNNANQAYFDFRLKRPEAERHGSQQTTITRIQAPKMGDYVFSVIDQASESGDPENIWLYVFTVDNDVRAVRMKTYSTNKAPKDTKRKIKATYIEGCDLLWRQEAGQLHGKLAGPTCKIGTKEQSGTYDMFLSNDALWVRSQSSGEEHYAMQRARNFNCYIDVPGVGGGRDIPFERIHINGMHDLGSERWVTTKDGMEIGLSMFRVLWPMNNYHNTFTRPSFVIYVKEKLENGESKEKGYAWTIPKAERIGINLKWMLANCSMLSNEEIPAFYKTDEPLVNP